MYEYLRTELLSDPELPGTFINEQDVALSVGVSRTPVREALLMLSAQHLLQLVPHRGAFVPMLTGEQFNHVFAAREMIEKWCAHDVIARGCPPLEEMRDTLATQRELTSDPKAFIEADRDFHAALIAASGNAVLVDMYEALHMRHVLIGLTAIRRAGVELSEVILEHEAIVDALASGDVAAVDAAIEAHLESSRNRLLGGCG